MKRIINILLLFCIVITSCNDENYETNSMGILINHTKCKDFSSKSQRFSKNYGTNVSGIIYSYNYQTKKLFLKHINSGFNCCPGKLTCNVSMVKDTIYIIEKEQKKGCDCECLYDLEILIENIKLQKYHILIDEPYIKNQNKISFDIDLAMYNSGEFFVTRYTYPWGI